MRGMLTAALVFVCLPAWAQDDAAMPVAIDIQKPDIAPIEPFPEGYRALLFTPHEHLRIVQMVGGRLPTPAAAVVDDIVTEVPLPLMEEGQTIDRVLHLSGIVYANPQDWSIWINGRQISPRAQPDEVRGIRVSRDVVELQWYDAINETVVPVRLRPQQRFSLDTRSFVPAVGEPVPAIPPEAPAETPAEPAPVPVMTDPDDVDDWFDEEWFDDEAMLWDLLEYDLP